MANAPTLTTRALNRALLARQLLLERLPGSVTDAIEQLVALQAQVPVDPYVALWSRLAGFEAPALSRLLEAHAVGRAPLLRATIHLCSARDLLALRPIVAPVLERNFRSGSPFGRRLPGVDMGPVVAAAEAAMDERPRTRAELRALLGARWPDRDADAMGTAVSLLAPVVQVPPRGLWGRSGLPTWARMETWLDAPLDPTMTLESLVLRYLGAYGPASPADAGMWSGLTHLGEVFERLRSRLVTFRSPAGRELFDLPDAPRPDPDTPAPVRYLPQYDNLVLSHADRSRVVPAGTPSALGPEVWVGTILADGMVAATWRLEEDRGSAIIAVRPRAPVDPPDLDAIHEEGRALARFLRPAAASLDVRIAPAP